MTETMPAFFHLRPTVSSLTVGLKIAVEVESDHIRKLQRSLPV